MKHACNVCLHLTDIFSSQHTQLLQIYLPTQVTENYIKHLRETNPHTHTN